jgi:hypothetical protein
MVDESNEIDGAEGHEEVLDELRRRLTLLDSFEYQQSACYKAGSRILADSIVWSLVAAAITATTVFVWLR